MIVQFSQFMMIQVFTITMVILSSTRTQSCAVQIELNVLGLVNLVFVSRLKSVKNHGMKPKYELKIPRKFDLNMRFLQVGFKSRNLTKLT